VLFAEPALSRLNPAKPQLPRRIQQLNISADERTASRAAKAPHPCGGELKGVRSFQRKSIDELFGAIAQFVARLNLLPAAAQSIENYLSLHSAVQSQLANSRQTSECALHLDWRTPPNYLLIFCVQSFNC
jgi:hypothetical protein